MRGFNYKKAVQALNFFAEKEGGQINKMKAIKLIWLSDKLHLISNGRTITGDNYYAMKNGPVPSSTRNILEQNNIALEQDELDYSSSYILPDGYDFKTKKTTDLTELSKSDLSVLEQVYLDYGKYDKFYLSEMSHEFKEWEQYKSALDKKIASRFPIAMEDLFFPAPKKYSLFQISDDIINESRVIFETEANIVNFFK